MTLARVMREGLRRALELDFAFLRTITALTVDPGAVCRAYVDGERHSYSNPLKYAFVTATIHALAVTLLPVNLLGGEHSPWQTAQAIEGFHLAHGLLGYLIFPMTLVLATLQRTLFRGHAANVAECYVCLLFVYGHLMWFMSAFALLGLFETTVGSLVTELVAMAYVIWAVAEFYRDYRAATLLRAALLRIVGSLLFVAVTYTAGGV